MMKRKTKKKKLHRKFSTISKERKLRRMRGKQKKKINKANESKINRKEKT